MARGRACLTMVTAAAVEAVWRIESARIVAALARITGDLGLAEDLAQEALVEALEQWPSVGAPRNPGAWLTAVAKRRAIDGGVGASGSTTATRASPTTSREAGASSDWEPIADDVLRLVFTACSPVAVPGVAGRADPPRRRRPHDRRDRPAAARPGADRAGAHHAGEEGAGRGARAVRDSRAGRVGESARGGAGGRLPDLHRGLHRDERREWMRPDLAEEALRLGRMLAGLVPRSRRRIGLLALMELQASRFARAAGPGRRAGAARGPGPRRAGTARRSPAGGRRSPGRTRSAAARPVRAAGGHRRAARDRAFRRGDRLGGDRRLYDGARRARRTRSSSSTARSRSSMAGGPAAGLALVDELAATRRPPARPSAAERPRRAAHPRSAGRGRQGMRCRGGRARDERSDPGGAAREGRRGLTRGAGTDAARSPTMSLGPRAGRVLSCPMPPNRSSCS